MSLYIWPVRVICVNMEIILNLGNIEMWKMYYMASFYDTVSL
jgi:hypothetical protein